jgi:dipeptidyl aminopeptidase/acylaminoacyl peptidase
VGDLGAYLTPDPQDGKRHPAIIWITGGDCNSIGEVWDAMPEDNDQCATAYRNAGLIMMFPSLRGGNMNPGFREGFLGEVEDVLAAAEYLSRQPYVDSGRIYLGGHSTGGTLALLVAECSPRFRAVFAFGPVEDVGFYGEEYKPFDSEDRNEVRIRSPIHWLNWIACRTFVIEGEGGNIQSLHAMMKSTSNEWVRFVPVVGADHFDVLSPTNRLIAKKILADKGSACSITIGNDEVSRLFKR